MIPDAQKMMFLCMSGGGFRAALFHYGVLKRLRELDLLDSIGAISAASGGAFVAALFKVHRDDWDVFEEKLLGNIRKGIMGPVTVLLVSYCLYFVALVSYILQRPLRPGTNALFGCVVIALVLQFGALALMRCPRAVGHLPLAAWARAAFSPAELRIETISSRFFDRELLASLFSYGPSTYLMAVDLNSGREMAMTAGLLADLGPVGCRYLWEMSTGRREYRQEGLTIARAVAASSAFPPVFKPVRIGAQVLADGGTVDNFAINLPKAFSVHIAEERQRYAAGGIQSFSRRFGRLLISDGSRYLRVENKASYTRLVTPYRLMEVIAHQQSVDLGLTASMLEASLKLHTSILSLGVVGLPPDDPLRDPRFIKYVSRVRTHLDSFSEEECAAIAYCGYRMADSQSVWVAEPSESVPPLATIEGILPERYRPANTSMNALLRHLRHSEWRALPIRWLLRLLVRRLESLRG